MKRTPVDKLFSTYQKNKTDEYYKYSTFENSAFNNFRINLDCFTLDNVENIKNIVNNHIGREIYTNDDVLRSMKLQYDIMKTQNFNEVPLHINDSYVGTKDGLTYKFDLNKIINDRVIKNLCGNYAIQEEELRLWKIYDPRGNYLNTLPFNPLDIFSKSAIRNLEENEFITEYVGPGC